MLDTLSGTSYLSTFHISPLNFPSIFILFLLYPPTALMADSSLMSDSQVRGAYSRLNQAKARIDQRTAKGQWGTVLGDDDVKEVPASDLEPLSRGIEELDRRHRKGIAEFTQRLPSQVRCITMLP